MSRKFLTPVDLSKNELQNAVVQNLAGAPSTPVKGQIYMNTSDNTLYWWDGTVWQPAKSGAPAFGSVVTETGFGQASANGSLTTVARSDHTHGSPTHDNAAHSAVTLNSLAIPTAAINMNGQKITNLGAPTALTDAATRQYVDNVEAGMVWKDPVRAATTANITLSAPQTVDGVAVTGGQRVLVKNQSAAAQNGIYTVNAGAWTRPEDADSATEVLSAAVFVSEGTVNADTAWVCTADSPITLETTALPFVQFAGGGAVTAGAGLTQTGNTINVGAGTSITVNADDVAVVPATTAVVGATRLATTAEATAQALTTVAVTPAGLADRTLTSRTVTAGNGLTGGGDLTANRTFDVGAGNGITVAADAVAANFTTSGVGDNGVLNTVARGDHVHDQRYSRYYQTLVGGSTSQVITHNFGYRTVVVQLFRTAAPYDTVECDVERTDGNSVTMRFATAPSSNEYTAVVIG